MRFGIGCAAWCVDSGGVVFFWFVFFFQAEDGIRDLVRSRGLGDVYKRQGRGKSRRPEQAARRFCVPSSAAGLNGVW